MTVVVGKMPLSSWQMDLVWEFTGATKEYFLEKILRNNNNLVPENSRMWFYTEDNVPTAFMWAQQQPHEDGGKVLRVHACYIMSGTEKKVSDNILSKFEARLTIYAKSNGMSHVGFYTVRNPWAFVRRLNRTSPKPWSVDSYVLTRKV